MAIGIIVAVWLGVAILAIGVVRFIKGEDFEGEDDIPPCILWPVCVALIVPVGVGWLLLYWVPIHCADFLRSNFTKLQQRHKRRLWLPQQTDWRQPDKEIRPPDWR